MTLSPTITLTADVIDAVSEAVAAPPTPAARATVIASLMTEMYATVQWRWETSTPTTNSPASRGS